MEALNRQTFKDFEVILTHDPGVSKGFNAGIDQAKGDILVFTEADCVPTDAWLEELVPEVEKGRLVTGIEVFPSPMSPSNIAIRKEDLGSIRFERYDLANDTEFFWILASKGIKIKRIDKAVVFHMQKRKPTTRLKFAFGLGVSHARIYHKYRLVDYQYSGIKLLLIAPLFRIVEALFSFSGSVYGLLRYLPERRKKMPVPENKFEDNEARNPRF
jgi:glycosyltransferase involved in cell wall biosynthesis